MIDPDEFRAEARRGWEEAAAGWEERREAHHRTTEPVAVRLIEHLEPQPGYTLLELAAGTGETGLLAAELVEPGGTVIITDGAEAMVAAAQRGVDERGVRNVEVRQMEAEWIDLPAASVDGVLSRWGIMLLADPGAAMGETRRVLRPGGRVAIAVWAPPEDNPWMTVIGRSALDLGLTEPPQPDAPGPFALADTDRLEELLGGAGFGDVRIEPVDFRVEHESADDYFEHQRTMSPTLRGLLPTLSPADHTRLRDTIDERVAPYVADDGSVSLPARSWVASGLA